MDNMSIKGLNYKHSFYKFMNNIVHLEFRRAFKQITIIADQFGDSDYMQSFCRYVDMHQDQPNLFGDADFQFQDSRNALGIQVADIISGTLAYVFDTHKKGPNVPDYISLMSPKIIRIELYPKTFQNYVLENSPLADDYDKDIAELCFAQAVKFIEHNASEIDSDIRAQVIVLQYLLFRFMNNGTRGYIVTRELRDQLRNTELRSISDTAFRMRIIGRLRDKGVIIASSPQGYKIPSKRSELHDFINHDAKIVMPMLARLKKSRDLVKLATINQLDLFRGVLGGFLGHWLRISGLGRPGLALPGIGPGFRQGAGREEDLEGDGAGFRYIEAEVAEFQFLDGVRDFDVLIPLDLPAVLVEANRYGVPQFGCQLSAFHDLYLQMFDMCLAAE